MVNQHGSIEKITQNLQTVEIPYQNVRKNTIILYCEKISVEFSKINAFFI